MKNILERCQHLKTIHEEKRRESDRASGALEQWYSDLHKKFGCTTLGEAEKLLKKKQTKLESVKDELTKELEHFEQTYGESLQGDEA